MKTLLCCSLTVTLILLAGCSARLGVVSPDTVDLTGTWLLDPEKSEVVMLARHGGRAGRSAGGQGRPAGGAGRKGNGGRQGNKGQRPSAGSGSAGFPGKPEAMQNSEMFIEQGVDSMGVQYLNAGYRDVDWGKTKTGRQSVHAGWRGEELIIKTSTERLSYSESYQLQQNGAVLLQTIMINGQKKPNRFARVFTRKSLNSAL